MPVLAKTEFEFNGQARLQFKDFGLQIGASVFSVKDAWATISDPEAGYWFYTQGTVAF